MAIVELVTSFEDIKVELVERNPDLLVYVTERKHEAKGKDEIWYFDKSFEDIKVKLVKSFSDLKVQYVDQKYKAGWKNKKHEMQGRIG